jgi:hypothetical protein
MFRIVATTRCVVSASSSFAEISVSSWIRVSCAPATTAADSARREMKKGFRRGDRRPREGKGGRSKGVSRVGEQP